VRAKESLIMHNRLPVGRPLSRGLGLVLIAALVAGSVTSVTAHIIRGLSFPAFATAFVSSPSAALDAPVPITWAGHDTGLRVACFYVANTSPPLPGTGDWPRITAVGFELPGLRSGFSLNTPLDGDWELLQQQPAELNGVPLTLDFVLVARANPTGRTPGRPDSPAGIPPGQQAARGNGVRFCVSGPFPDGLNIEQIINGVVVRFHQVEPRGIVTDLGVWDSPQRTFPQYPQ
jgi:hypothetical protein